MLYCRMWRARLYSIFPHCLINGTIFGKSNWTHCVFWFSIHRLSETLIILRRTEEDTIINGNRGSTVAKCCATNRKVAGSIPAGVSGFFIDIKSFRSHYGPGVESASNGNEYQEVFPGGKSGRCVRLKTLPPSWAIVTQSENRNFLEPSWPVQACNGTALLS